MIDYPALSALSAVLRSGSFDRAAAQLGVTQSAISQRIKGLGSGPINPAPLAQNPRNISGLVCAGHSGSMVKHTEPLR